MKFNKCLIVLLVLAIFLSINLACASDVNSTDVSHVGADDAISVNDVSYSNLDSSSFNNVNSVYDFENAMNEAHCAHVKYNNHILNLTKKSYIFDTGNDVLFHIDYGNVIINGNGATLSCNGKTFFSVGKNVRLSLSNVTFTGCKPAIRSYGNVVAYNVTFVDNQRSDTVNSPGLMREGGAIDNFADLTCANCTFKNNKGSYGGAVCGEDGSVSKFLDCKWGGNSGTGEDLYMGNGASAYVFLNQLIRYHCLNVMILGLYAF